MRRCPLVLAVTLLNCVAATVDAAAAQTPHSASVGTTVEVVAAERAFAARAQAVDARDAFIEYFAPDAIGFSPEVGPALPGLVASPPWGVNIGWRPVDAGGSSSGDLGWTTGPAEYRRSQGDASPYGWGYYTSVWARQRDGRWQVLADIGIKTPAPTVAVADWTASAVAGGMPAGRTRHEPRRQARLAARLLDLDRALARRAARDSDAFRRVVGERSRFHRDDAPPAVGRNAVLDALRDGSTTYRWLPVAARVASAGDLGFTYGSGARITTSGEHPFHYLAIWERRGGDWSLRTLVHSRPPEKR